MVLGMVKPVSASSVVLKYLPVFMFVYVLYRSFVAEMTISVPKFHHCEPFNHVIIMIN